MEYKQFVFLLDGVWNTSCSCNYREESRMQQEAQEKRDVHAINHQEVPDTNALSDARVEFLNAFASLDHVGSGMADRLRRFHAAWAGMNDAKRKNNQTTVPATKPRLK